MPATKKPRKAYKPRDVVPVPLVFGSSPQMLLNLSLRTRAAIDAVLAHEQAPMNLSAVECEVVAGLHLVDAAQQHPDAHQIDAGSIAEVRAELQRIGRAVLGIKTRRVSTGRIGCSADEREALLSLAGLMDTLREGLPRRLWHEAYRRSLERAEIAPEEIAA